MVAARGATAVRGKLAIVSIGVLLPNVLGLAAGVGAGAGAAGFGAVTATSRAAAAGD